jgi:hypothetical protein
MLVKLIALYYVTLLLGMDAEVSLCLEVSATGTR